MANPLVEQGGKLDAEQQHIAKQLIRIGRRDKAGGRGIVTALVTGLQESGLRNLPIGAETSGGWRQEQARYFPDPTNVKHSAERFYKELKSAPKGSIGSEAQATQKSAYPSLYQPHIGEARQILKMLRNQVPGGNLSSKQASMGDSLQAGKNGRQVGSQTPTSGVDFSKTQQGKIAALDFIQHRTEPGAISDYISQKTAYTLGNVRSEKAISGNSTNLLSHKNQEQPLALSDTPVKTFNSGLVRWAEKVIGTDEGSPRQSKWAALSGISPSTAWCSAFVAYGLHKQGYQLPSSPAYSGSWLSWSGGKKVNYKNARPGDLLIFDWGDGGITDHVGIYIGHGQYIGGNNSDNSVGKSSVPTGNIVGVVRPKKKR